MNKQKILIVDDDANIAELIALYLTKECFDTRMVHDGEMALEVFDNYQPCLLYTSSYPFSHRNFRSRANVAESQLT